MKTLLLALILFLLVSVFAASGFATEGKSVSYKSGDDTVSGILYRPAGKGAVPCPDRDSRMVGTE